MIIGLVTLLLLLLLAIIGYDVMIFHPYCSQIQAMIQRSQVLYSQESLHKIVTFVEGQWGMRISIARNLLITFKQGQRQRMVNWHVNNALWTCLIGLHFTRAEEVLLWCSVASFENLALNELAHRYYDRDIDGLNMNEMLTIVALVRFPALYRTSPERFEEKVNELFTQYVARYGEHEYD